jgi:hypothetical protein
MRQVLFKCRRLNLKTYSESQKAIRVPRLPIAIYVIKVDFKQRSSLFNWTSGGGRTVSVR